MGDVRAVGKDCDELEALKNIFFVCINHMFLEFQVFPVVEDTNLGINVSFDKFGQDRVSSSACFEGNMI